MIDASEQQQDDYPLLDECQLEAGSILLSNCAKRMVEFGCEFHYRGCRNCSNHLCQTGIELTPQQYKNQLITALSTANTLYSRRNLVWEKWHRRILITIIVVLIAGLFRHWLFPLLKFLHWWVLGV